MDRYRELEEQRRAVRERLRGATRFLSPVRGWMYKMADGSMITELEYKRLRRESGIWWIL
ncbi:hypothetical protein phiPsa347_009 [Pseudomonas phage phiPsa347]|uniref:Uncharacterized protein n=1 Tax=Pseudomonas phage phiPsa347 TaxID=1460364 RepID=A0A7G9V2M8_9CAUD|nr:hypothetical protein QGX18_gp009 [Pseudomonas phage phiPsa347]QNO00534.1 hypothetical protein phiPsa347_009 [Pseudomonas phage phiPsa347]